MADERTPNMNLPLPAGGNKLRQDVERIRETINVLDTALDLDSFEEGLLIGLAGQQIGEPPLVGGVPDVTDTLQVGYDSAIGAGG